MRASMILVCVDVLLLDLRFNETSLGLKGWHVSLRVNFGMLINITNYRNYLNSLIILASTNISNKIGIKRNKFN